MLTLRIEKKKFNRPNVFFMFSCRSKPTKNNKKKSRIELSSIFEIGYMNIRGEFCSRIFMKYGEERYTNIQMKIKG